jgi:hypothetical protein
MKLVENKDGWFLSLNDGRVGTIQIDFRLSLLITDGTDAAWFRFGTQGRLKGRTTEITLVPAQTTTLAPILSFFNAAVLNVRIARTGEAVIEFGQDSSLIVAPDQTYEAWQFDFSLDQSEMMLICAPGGDVAVFRDSKAPERTGNVRFD